MFYRWQKNSERYEKLTKITRVLTYKSCVLLMFSYIVIIEVNFCIVYN